MIPNFKTVDFSSITKLWKAVLSLVIGVGVCLGINARIYDIRGKYVAETVSEIGQLPSPLLQPLSLEFQGVVADYLFFRTMTYMGLKLMERKNPSREEWQVMYQMLERITDLDGRFWDPYVFAESMLAWQARMLDEVEALLLKAVQSRPWDYRPSYFIGFNYLYFKKNAEKAAPHLRAAARIPGAPRHVKGLASRFSLYAGQTGLGIFFLENLIKDTADPKTVGYLQTRLTALKMIFFLEEKVKAYEGKLGHAPKSLDDLVTEGLIESLPDDPYGGKFVLTATGRVYTTSQMVEKTNASGEDNQPPLNSSNR